MYLTLRVVVFFFALFLRPPFCTPMFLRWPRMNILNTTQLKRASHFLSYLKPTVASPKHMEGKGCGEGYSAGGNHATSLLVATRFYTLSLWPVAASYTWKGIMGSCDETPDSRRSQLHLVVSLLHASWLLKTLNHLKLQSWAGWSTRQGWNTMILFL